MAWKFRKPDGEIVVFKSKKNIPTQIPSDWVPANSKGRTLWEKIKRAGGTFLKWSIVPPVAAVKAIQNARDKDFFGNESNINADLVGVNPNAAAGNENVDLNKLTPEAREQMFLNKNRSSNARKGIREFFLGSPAEKIQFDLLSPDQKELYKQQVLPYILNQIGSAKGTSLSDYAKEFEPFEQDIRQNYYQKTLPSIAERFAGMGSHGNFGSSGFLNELSNSAQELEKGIGRQKQQFALENREQQRRNALNLIGYGLQPQHENTYAQRQPGFLENIAGPAAEGATKLGFKYLLGM